ncbi:MAG: SUMF1/EgtB/PvdO family nonheme iron enzyme [Myxococcales bacterium]|nr:SUMF1/EgtB/PvdO family nonheme iron enzyme [Myxococcales bacterium]
MRLRSCLLIAALMACAEASAAPAPSKLPDGKPIIACAKAPEGMACIRGGPFLRGTNRKWPRNARPQATVWLQTFYMDKTEVTVAAFNACVKAKKCKPAKTWYSDYSRPRQPKVGVSWFDARNYCRAMGKHLPTEAQWEKAARGSDGRLHPWGNQRATCKRTVIKDHRGRSCGVKKLKGKHPEKGRTLVVGSRPPNQFGIYDMAGNAQEWVADWYTTSFARCGKDCLGVDPKGPCGGADKCPGYKLKMVRGGSWYWPAEHATCVFRRPHVPKNRPYHHFGFRCAASVDEARALAK